MDRIRILVAEDDARLRRALVELLRLEPEFDVVADAGDGETALQQAGVLMPDVVLTDLEMPRLDGIGLIRRAECADMLLLVENDAKYWSAYPQNAKRLFRDFAGPNLMAAFDFANAHLLGTSVEEWFPWIVPYLDTIHIKDAKDGRVVPAGQGDAGIPLVLQSLWRENWSGALSLEPHLAAAGAFGGFSGEDLFAEAANALYDVLRGIEA